MPNDTARTQRCCTLLLTMLILLPISGSDIYYVDPAVGLDSNNGHSLNSAFKNVQRCIDKLRGSPTASSPGSECRLRGGTYRSGHDGEPILIEHLRGEPQKPYVIGAYAGEQVEFDGTIEVHPNCSAQSGQSPWEKVPGNFSQGGAGAPHWATTLSVGMPAPWQLFVGKWGAEPELFVNARWPSGKFNGRWDDKSIFSSSTWKQAHPDSTLSHKPTSRSMPISTSVLLDEDSSHPSLSESGIDAKGATVVMNFRGWKTVSTVVLAHERGREGRGNRFSYQYQLEWGVPRHENAKVDLYYLENKLQFLDVETEWFYDHANRRLHVRTRNDEHPCFLRILARTQTYAFKISDTRHLVLQDMNFFATTIWAGALGLYDGVHGISFDSLAFKFPHAGKRMLGDHTFLAPTTLYTRNSQNFSGNSIVNCTFTGSEGDPLLHINGNGMLLANNRMRWNDWTTVSANPCWPGSGKSGALPSSQTLGQGEQGCFLDEYATTYPGAAALSVGSSSIHHPSRVTRNTVEHFGPGSGILVGKNSLVDLNEVSHPSDLQRGGSLLQSSAHDLIEDDENGLSIGWAPKLCHDFNLHSGNVDSIMLAWEFCTAPDMKGCIWVYHQDVHNTLALNSNPSSCRYLNECNTIRNFLTCNFETLYRNTLQKGVSPFICEGFPEVPGQPPDTVVNSNTSKRYGVRFRFNWAHDAQHVRTSKRGMQFVRDEGVCNGRFGHTWPSWGEMYRNVVWKTAGVEAEGGNHIVSRNTIFETGGGQQLPVHGTLQTPMRDDKGLDLSKVYDVVFDNGELNHTGTCVCGKGDCSKLPNFCCVAGLENTVEGAGNIFTRNAMHQFYGTVGGGTWGTSKIESTASVDAKFVNLALRQNLRASGNSAGVLFQELENCRNLDFRPSTTHSTFAKKSIGAYEVLGEKSLDEYWIPGRQEYRASRPVPENLAAGVARDFELMFLPGRTRRMYAKAHRIFVACTAAMVRSLADKALKQADRSPELRCNCQPAISRLAETVSASNDPSLRVCNVSFCREPGCWVPTSGLDGVEGGDMKFNDMNARLCKRGLEARLTGNTRNMADFLESSFSQREQRHIHMMQQYQYTCCPSSDTMDTSVPPGVAGQRWLEGVETDAVCPKSYRYRCANIYAPPKHLNLARAGVQVFWRVDSIMTTNGLDMHLVPGDIWSFTTAPNPTSEPTRSFLHPFGKPEGSCPSGSGRVCTTRYSDHSSVSLPSNKQSSYLNLVEANITIDSRYFHPDGVYVLKGVRVCISNLTYSAGINKLGMKFMFPYDAARSKHLWLASENGQVSNSITSLRDVCFQDQNGFLTKLSSSPSLTFGRANGPVVSGKFASREESLAAVIGDLGTCPFGGNVMLSVQVTHAQVASASGYLSGWYVELDFEGGDGLFQEWTARENDRLDRISRDQGSPWCLPPPVPETPTCPEWLKLKDGVTYCPAKKSLGVHREGNLCKSDNTWRDSFGDGCHEYQVNPMWCRDSHHFAIADRGAAHACCVCGGGTSSLLGHPCPLIITLSPPEGQVGDSVAENQKAPRIKFAANMQLEPWQCFTFSSVPRERFSWRDREIELKADTGTIEPVSQGLFLMLAKGMPDVRVAFTAQAYDSTTSKSIAEGRRPYFFRKKIPEQGNGGGAHLELFNAEQRRQFEGVCAHEQVYRVLALPDLEEDNFCICEGTCMGADVDCAFSPTGVPIYLTAVKMPQNACANIERGLHVSIIIAIAVTIIISSTGLAYAVHVRLKRGCSVTFSGTSLRIFPLDIEQMEAVKKDKEAEEMSKRRAPLLVSGVNFNITLGLGFEIAGEDGSAQRAAFIRELVQNISFAAEVPSTRFDVTRLSAGSILAEINILHGDAGPDSLSVAQHLAKQLHDPESRLRMSSLTQFSEGIDIMPHELAAQKQTERLFSMNGLDSRSDGPVFSWKEAVINTGGADARLQAKTILSADTKRRLHLNGLNRLPAKNGSRVLLPVMPARSKFERIRAEREARLSTITMYMDLSLMDGGLRRAGAWVRGGVGREGKREGVRGVARLPPIESGASERREVVRSIIPSELLEPYSEISSTASIGPSRAGAGTKGRGREGRKHEIDRLDKHDVLGVGGSLSAEGGSEPQNRLDVQDLDDSTRVKGDDPGWAILHDGIGGHESSHIRVTRSERRFSRE